MSASSFPEQWLVRKPKWASDLSLVLAQQDSYLHWRAQISNAVQYYTMEVANIKISFCYLIFAASFGGEIKFTVIKCPASTQVG